ncbi:transcription initiation factor TFIID subunit 4b-like protein, partial [Trifolium pratense]
PAIPVVPYDRLFPFLFPHIDQDKVDEIQALFEKYKRDEIIPKSSFFARVTDIVGIQLVYSATMQLQEQQNKNHQVPVNEQFTTQINSSDLELPFDQLYPFLIPHITDPDKAIELKVLFDQYRRCEIPKDTFVPVMTCILGEQIFKSAAAKVKQLKSNLQVNEQPGIQINSSDPGVTFNQLFHLLAPQIGIERTIDLYFLGDKYQRGEIPMTDFLPLIKGIVGKQAFKLAAETLLRQVELVAVFYKAVE